MSVNPLPVAGQVTAFPVAARAQAVERGDQVVVIHRGAVATYDAPEALQRAILNAALPEIRASLDRLETKAASLGQAAGKLATSNGLLRDQINLMGDHARRTAEANAVRVRHAAGLFFAAGAALGVAAAALLLGVGA